MRLAVLLLFIAAAARADVTAPTPTPPTTKLPTGHVPRVLLAEWRKAENRAGCAPVWLDDAGAGVPIRARYFGGGWDVSVRNPHRWGVAGAGVLAAPSDLEKWKFRRENAAGMRAGYGL